jgi:hypothetical protein
MGDLERRPGDPVVCKILINALRRVYGLPPGGVFHDRLEKRGQHHLPMR